MPFGLPIDVSFATNETINFMQKTFTEILIIYFSKLYQMYSFIHSLIVTYYL